MNDNISNQFYEIIIGKNRFIKKYDARLEYKVKFKNISSDMIESLQMIHDLFTQIINYIKCFVNPKDSVKIYIDHPNYDGGDIQTRFQKGSDLNADVVINSITRLVKSGKLLSLDEKLKFNILIINYLTGSGLKRIADYLYKKLCVVRVKTSRDDNLCGFPFVSVKHMLMKKIMMK
jgi:hypothetical protein